MPAIPYKPFPDQEPTDRPTPYLNVRALPEAFGVNIGEALHRSGDELFGRAMALQQVRNHSDADELSSKYIIEAGKLRAQFNSLEGKNSPDALEQHGEDLENLRTKIGSEAKNDFTRKLYDGHTRGFMAREVFAAGGRAGEQNKQYNHKVIEDGKIAVHDEIAHRPGDQKTIDAAKERLKFLSNAGSDLKGYKGETREVEERRDFSKLLRTQIISEAKKNPFNAERLLKVNEADIQGDDLTAVRDAVDNFKITKGSQIIAEDLIKPPIDGRFDKSEEEYLKAGTEKAGDDPLMRKAVQSAVTGRYNMFKTANRNYYYDLEQILSRAITGDYGKFPASIPDMLKLHPEIEDAWQKLPASMRGKYYSSIAALQKMPDLERRSYERGSEGIQRYQTLIGMKHENPRDFMNIHIPGEQFTVPTIQSLIRMQADLSKKADEDPRMPHALQVIRNNRGIELNELGILKHTESNSDEYYRFVGAIQMGLDKLKKEKGGEPKDEEILTMADEVMKHKTFPWYRFDKTNEEPMYNKPVPDKWREDMVEAAKKLGKEQPTEEDIRRSYVRKLFRESKTGATGKTKDQSRATQESK
jgi:hypothetical protein